ncbi:hypothetical protein [Glaciecola sp. MF2-115]|uniref:hypothetical protein n=1 Tax=Glaciecola sp. MF2-115 TaxID=3384827 RepID=UPI00399FB131
MKDSEGRENPIRMPIRIKHLPNFIADKISQKKLLAKSTDSDITFNLCFFSCESYFDYLHCSIHSVVNQLSSFKYKIFVFNDSDQPITNEQSEILRNLSPQVEIILWPKSMGWGAEQISNIWRAYEYAAEQAKPNDIIARVDSDVFFVNERIFKQVAAQGADLMGDGHFVDFKYCQGGCYFFKASAVRKIVNLIATESMEKLVKEIDVEVEDVAATAFAKKLNLNVVQTWFMGFPNELEHNKYFIWWFKSKFSCVHFVMKNKDKMLTAYLEYFDNNPNDKFSRHLKRKV